MTPEQQWNMLWMALATMGFLMMVLHHEIWEKRPKLAAETESVLGLALVLAVVPYMVLGWLEQLPRYGDPYCTIGSERGCPNFTIWMQRVSCFAGCYLAVAAMLGVLYGCFTCARGDRRNGKGQVV
jgi:hypothetical protein